jgi:hypothetical protein
MMKTGQALFFIIFFSICGALSLHAADAVHNIRKVVIIPASDDLVLNKYADSIKDHFSDEGLKLITARITDIHIDAGYTFSRVDRAVLKLDGTFEIYLSDPVIRKIQVQPPGSEPEMLQLLSSRLEGRVYNSFQVKRAVNDASVKFRLTGVRARPVLLINGDVALNIEAEKISPWSAFINADDLGAAGRSLEAEGEFRADGPGFFMSGAVLYHDLTGPGCRGGGGIRYYFTGNLSAAGTVAGAAVTERLETGGINYRKNYFRAGSELKLTTSPHTMGMNCYGEYISLSSEYPGSGSYHGAGADIYYRYSDRDLLLAPEESLEAEVKSAINVPENIFSMDAAVSKGLAPFHGTGEFTVRPALRISGTTSDNRYRMNYLHDGALYGFRENFTAVRNKSGLSVKFQYELIDTLLFVSAVYSGMIFTDHAGMRDTLTAGAVFAEIRAGGLGLQAGAGSPVTGDSPGPVGILRLIGTMEF